jgi:hypothetical protein
VGLAELVLPGMGYEAAAVPVRDSECGVRNYEAAVIKAAVASVAI